MAALALGIDVGTTGVKALLLSSGGDVVASASSHHGIIAAAGHVEARPDDWWRSVVRAIRALGVPLADVAVVGLSGNMSSVVLLDADGLPMSAAPLLADTRGREQIASLPAALSERITRLTFNQPSTVFSLATLLWLRDTRPELLASCKAWVSAKDYVRLRLTGVIATDPTDAYNSLLIPADAETWDTELLTELGLPGTCWPELRYSTARGGQVTALAAAETGLAAGTPVVVGAGDMAAAVVGAGALDPGTLLVSLGTSMTATVAVDHPQETLAWNGALSYHPLPDGDGGFALASLLTGGLAVNWLRDELRLEVGAHVAQVESGDPLLFLPHLAGTGTPDFDPLACGTLLGVRPSTTRAEIVAALYEALGFELADIADLVGLAPDARVILTGGGTRLPGWTQNIADALEREVEITPAADVSAIGAARLALAGIGAEQQPAGTEATRRLAPQTSRQTRRARYRVARAAAIAFYDSTSEWREP